MVKHANVIGAGPVGSTLAVLLARRGYQVDLFERTPDTRGGGGVSFARSINLALSARGLHTLSLLGLAQEALANSIPMPGRIIHDSRGEVEFQPYGLEPHECLHSISRRWLDGRLKDAAEAAGVKIHFGQKAVSLAEVTDASGATRRLDGPVFGCDGAYSTLRQSLIRHERVNYSQEFLDYGYRELTIAAGADGAYRLDPGGLHIWPRADFMLIALPDPGGSFTATLFAPFSRLDQWTDPQPVFEEYFPDALAVIDNLEAEWAHPVGAMVTVRLSPWYYQDRVLLLGDAAHALVPFYGQGMNSGLEDCSVLMELADEHAEDWPTIFRRFYEVRKPNTEAIADLAIGNLEEMQGKVDDPHFLRLKEIEKTLERELRDDYVSAYSMISHHRVPYRLAQQAGQIQQALLEELAAQGGELDLSRARTLVRERLGALMGEARAYLVS